MTWIQKEVHLAAKPRGFHLVTSEILRHLPDLSQFKVGLAHFFLQHTSASLTLNENADPDVRVDMESHFSKMIPDNASHFIHTLEGPEDMPAHLKNVILGSGFSVPVSKGRLKLGTWQGIYLCEHRNRGGRRTIVVTVWGET